MNYEPLIDGIAKLIGATGKAAEKGEGKIAGRTNVDVEQWLGHLSAPEKQVPVIHDYLRGHQALAEAEATGATHVRDISTGVWDSMQRRLQVQVDADPEVQTALRKMKVGMDTKVEPGLTQRVMPAEPRDPDPTSVEVPENTPTQPQAKLPRKAREALTAEQKKAQVDAWNEFSVALEEQDHAKPEQPRLDAAIERIQALHPETEPVKPGSTVEQQAGWQKAMEYMGSVEKQVQDMIAAKVPNEEWSKALETFKNTQGIDDVALPKHIRDAVTRMEAWADSVKPPSPIDRVNQILGTARAIQTSIDFSFPGKQGILMIGRPEYYESFKPMFESWSPEKFAEQQAYIRNHPDFETAESAGLALSTLSGKIGLHEEAFQAHLAEKIPVIGKWIKSSEQAYVTFANRLRMDTFSNEIKAASAAGVPIDNKFLGDLAEWINTATGRGGGKKFNPGVLSTILFAPRLAWARFQTLNPLFYARLHPYVRAQALKTTFSAAAAIYGLTALAALGGAKVLYDFRSSDAGKIRIGNTRIDLGGGEFQFIRLFTQIITNSKLNADTGKVTELGKKFGQPNRLDLMTQFIISKEAPVASFVTDWMKGKDMSGKPFQLGPELYSHIMPLGIQDVVDVLQDKGIQGLVYAAPAALGVGIQTYAPTTHPETIPFIGVKGEVPEELAQSYAKAIEDADKRAATAAAAKYAGKNPYVAKSILRAYIKAERMRVRAAWIRANAGAYRQARLAGEASVPLVAPEEATK